MNLKPHVAALLSAIVSAAPAFAAGEFDGSKALLCAPVDSVQCNYGEECARGEGDVVNLPRFFKIDAHGKVLAGIRGDDRSSPVRHVASKDGMLVLQGDQNGRAWSVVVSQESGDMTLTASADRGAFVVFGVCTPL